MNIRLFGSAALIALVSATLAVPASAKEMKKGATAKPAMVKSTAAGSTAAKPVLGSFGMDVAGMDKAIKPGDDFYKFANGTWDKTTVIPADKSNWSSFGILRDLSDARTRGIIDIVANAKNEPGSAAQKVGDFYASFMDEAAIEGKGLSPIQPVLDQIAAIQTPDQLAAAFGIANRFGLDVPVGIYVNQDAKDSSRYSAYITQGGLGLPDRDYYLDNNPRFVEIRAKYLIHIGNMLKLAGISDPTAKAQTIYDLEKKIAQYHWTQAESRQDDKTYNPVAVSDLAAKMPGFNWALFMQTAGISDLKTLIINQPSALTGAAKLVANEPINVWRDYMTFQMLETNAGYLPKAFVDERFAFRGPVLSGTLVLKDRWKRGVDLVNGAMGEVIGQLYVAQYLPPEAKAKADELVKNIIGAMDTRLSKLAWMSPETKIKARAKLAAMTTKIGYPDQWRNYDALKVERGDALGNALRATVFEYNRNLAKIGKPIDRSEWFLTPQTVNAYANPPMNEIVFPAAILQAPFFDPNADPAVNYGGIGMVIGHEISHHFDDQGRKYDIKGNLSDWWTAQDIKRFTGLTDKVVKQYAVYEPLKGSHVNGELTLGENMADLAGINIAYDAYKLSLKGKPAPVIDGYTGDQRFFLGFAQTWRSKYRDAALQQNITTDPHTPGHFRPYVVRNLDVWYLAFAAKPSDKSYIAPADRLKVW